MLKVLKSLDLFSVPFTPTIYSADGFKFKSKLGSFTSIVVLLASLLYSIYILYIWIDGQLLPVITRQTKVITEQIWLNNYAVNITADSWNANETLNPFQLVDNILTVRYFTDEDPNNVTTLTSDNGLIFSKKLDFDSLNIMYITISLCEQEYLPIGGSCASTEKINEYFAQPANEFWVNLGYGILDPNKQVVKGLIESQSISVEETLCSTLDIVMTPTEYQIDGNLIFSNSDSFNTIGEITGLVKTNSLAYCSQGYYQPNTYAVLSFTFNDYQVIERMEYPKIGTVLAMIGSIISVLFSVQYILREFNKQQLIDSMMHNMMHWYYPQLKLFIIKYNFFGKIVNITYQGKQITISSYQQYKAKVDRTLRCKLCYENLLYEMSRLQFIIQQSQGRDLMRKSHYVGVKLTVSESGETDSFQIDPDSSRGRTVNEGEPEYFNPQIERLVLKDTVLLSIENYNTRPQNSDLEMNDFYRINTILR